MLENHLVSIAGHLSSASEHHSAKRSARRARWRKGASFFTKAEMEVIFFQLVQISRIVVQCVVFVAEECFLVAHLNQIETLIQDYVVPVDQSVRFLASLV